MHNPLSIAVCFSPFHSKTAGNTIFTDDIGALRAEVNKLMENGVDKIIALGHSGFVKDREIAAKVNGVDLVVGGHSSTFLYTGILAHDMLRSPFLACIQFTKGQKRYAN